MPELPEVQTTVNGLVATIVGLRIRDVWTDYDSPYFKGTDTIKDPMYFKGFRKAVLGKKIFGASRRAKNILIHLERGRTSILVHMKMTGHLLYGRYLFHGSKKKDPWEPVEPEALKDPFNRHIHFVISFTNGRQLALSDMRKFAKVTLLHGRHMESAHLKGIGPEPLDKRFTFDRFRERLMSRPKWKIKQVLLDQTVLAGIGNIYADESLWRAGIHPLELAKDLPARKSKDLFLAIKRTLSRGIDFGGDSMSDYRNVYGEKGRFQEQHRAYRRTGKRCERPGCRGTIRRMVVGGRGTHYCGRHQRLSK